MKKSIWLLVLLVIVIIGIGAHKAEPGDTLYALKFWAGPVEYVADIEDEVTALEEELAELDAQIERGELSEEDAVAARNSITARIDTINATVTQSGKLTLSDADRARLSASLKRLTDALVGYRDSLIIVDEVAEGEVLGAVKATLNARPGTKRSSRLVSKITDAVESFEEHVEDVLGDEYEGDLTDIIESEGNVDENGGPIVEEGGDEMGDEAGTSTENGTEDDMGDDAEETEDDDAEDDSEDDMSDEETDGEEAEDDTATSTEAI